MDFAILLAASFVGLTAVFMALVLLRRAFDDAPVWRIGVRVFGALCVLAAGVVLVGGRHSLAARWLSVRNFRPEPRSPQPPTPSSASPALPRVTLDTSGIPPEKSSGKPYRFLATADWVSRVSTTWHKALADYKGRPDVRYLEVGLFEGRSAVWMLDNVLTHPTARLVGIDPFSDTFYTAMEPPSTTYKDVFFANLKASGSEQKAEIIQGYSQVELRKLPLGSFDIIYIDGSHHAPDVLEDAILSWRLLKDGGVLIFDDYGDPWGVKPAIETFFSNYGDHFRPLHVGWQVILKKNCTEGTSALAGH
jgi:SAM-dependent methyltransferase